MTTDIVAYKAKNNDILTIQSVLSANRSEVTLLQQPLREIRRNIRDFIIAEHGGKAIGCVALHIYSIDIAEIRGISVLPDYQNRGVGRTLLNKCIEIAMSKDIQTLWLATEKSTYFERYGFKTISKWSLPILALINKIGLLFQQPATHWLHALRGRQIFMKFNSD